MKIALIGAKGGTGKTTTAVTLARLWRAQRPLLLDLDTQAATQNFARVLKPCRLRFSGLCRTTIEPTNKHTPQAFSCL